MYHVRPLFAEFVERDFKEMIHWCKIFTMALDLIQILQDSQMLTMHAQTPFKGSIAAALK